MEVRVHLLPEKGSIGSMNPRGLNALVKALDPEATIFAAATMDNEKFEAARNQYAGTVIVAELPSAGMYEKVCGKLGWKKLKDVKVGLGRYGE